MAVGFALVLGTRVLWLHVGAIRIRILIRVGIGVAVAVETVLYVIEVEVLYLLGDVYGLAKLVRPVAEIHRAYGRLAQIVEIVELFAYFGVENILEHYIVFSWLDSRNVI